uniref:Tyrosine-protein kinase ephrin type A/B receptor-like domain-containing protein n=1 Tax=Octactis speculum TaxID=3111310 RepID=A0A7S2DY13_9STRA
MPDCEIMVLQGDALINYGSAVTITNTHFITMGKDSDLVPGSLECESSGCSAGQYGECKLVGNCYSCEVDICHWCSPGTYSYAGAVLLLDCQSCEAGRFKNVTDNKPSCSICESGHFSNNAATNKGGTGVASGATHCVMCPAGKYQNNNESYYCEDCPAGFFSSEGSSNCTACYAGTHTSSTGMSECETCERGKVASETIAAVSCNKCRGAFTSWARTTNCSICEEDYFMEDGICYECPENGECPLATGTTDIILGYGYWRVDPYSHQILQCTSNPDACIGGNSTLEGGYCQSNMGGPYCLICEKGYHRDLASCEECGVDGDGSVILQLCILAGLLICLVMMVIFFRKLHTRGHPCIDFVTTQSQMHFLAIAENYELLKAKFKINVVFSQIVSDFPGQFGFEYPEAYTRVAKELSNIFSLSFMSLVPAEVCMGYERHKYMIH